VATKRADRTGSLERWVGEQQRGERDVVGGLGSDGGGPVDDRHVAGGVDEHVEGVEVAMTDHGPPLHRSGVGQRPHGRHEVVSVQDVGGGLEVAEEIRDRPGHAGRGRPDGGADRFRIEGVERRHGGGQLARQVAEQGRCPLEGGEAVEIAER
jgi:hypothetical protein